MKRTFFWALLFLASSVVAIYATWRRDGLQGDFAAVVLPSVLGQVTALMLIPAIVAVVAILFAKLIRRSASDTGVFGLAGVAWIALALSHLVVSSYESSVRAAGYTFSPKDCEYSVHFPDMPELYSNELGNTASDRVLLNGAQLAVRGGNAFLRAECAAHPPSTQSLPSKDQVNTYMRAIAARLGLKVPVYEYRTDGLGTVGTITGTKDSERGTLTFRVINYIGNRSTMTLYVGSRATDFMTQEMQEFVASIER